MEVLGFLLDLLVAVGTLALAFFAFWEVHTGAGLRKAKEVDIDAERLLDREGGELLRDLRFTVLRWQKDPKLGTAMNHMVQKYKARIAEYHREMQKLRPLLIQLRQDLVNQHPEVDDGGSLGRISTNSSDPNNWLTLHRFDELATGAELRIQEREWRSSTIYGRPPGTRDSYFEDPAPERKMLEILEDRFRYLRRLERREDLQISNALHRGFAQARLWNGDVVNRLVDWKQISAEAAVYEILIFVEAMDPSYIPWTSANAAEQNLSELRRHLADYDFWEVAADPSQIDEINEEERKEIVVVVDALKQLIRQAVPGLRDELLATPSLREMLRAPVRWALVFGARNLRP